MDLFTQLHRVMKQFLFFLAFSIGLNFHANTFAQVNEDAARAGRGVTTSLYAASLADTKIGVDPERSVSVYLPAGYDEGEEAYPVLYYLHSIFWSNTQMFADGGVKRLLDEAIAKGTIRPVILVAADYSTPMAGSFYENSSTSGRWLDFTIDELIPFIDREFRTLPDRDSRGVVGDMMGAYGALRMAMLYPEVFGAVYAMHPFATGTGWVPMASVPNWERMHKATSFEDLEGDVASQVFLSMAQAFLPNPDRPPFYCDFMVEMEDGVLEPNQEHSALLKDRFLLDHMLPAHADGLRKMNGIKLDWGRYDPNQDHVYSNHAFTRKLDELGIFHFAEEYRGNTWNQNWIPHGRFADNVLPFFDRFLVFASH